MTAALDYRLVTEDDAEFQRIVAMNERDVVIAGAYRTRALNDWKIYLAKAFSESVDLPQPSKVHVVSRQEAIRWLDVLASLYMKALSQ